MTLRPGMSGDAVKRIEEFLIGLNLYSGPSDSSYGGGVASAVKTYQKQQGLPPSGLIDPITWSRMFPGQPPPVSEIVDRPLAERCLALTGSFETGKYAPDCFWGVTGDFDGMGISFGALQWNLGQRTLQPLLAEMFARYPAIAHDVFHEHSDVLVQLATAPVTDQLTFARSVQIRGGLQEPWHGMLAALGRTPECQSIQTVYANKVFEQALEMCNEYGLRSERAVALMFDIATQGGSITSIVRAQIMAGFAQLPPGDPTGHEVAKMVIVSNCRAAASKPGFVDDVRTRKLAIANGTGSVHGIYYDLDDMFGLTLNPFAQAQGATH